MKRKSSVFGYVSTKKEVAGLATHAVLPALGELTEEMKILGRNSSLEKISTNSIALRVEKNEAEDFYYEIKLRKYEMPEYSIANNKKFYRAEVFLLSGE